MSTRDRALLDALLRYDLAAFTQRCFQTVVPGQLFLPNWHIEAISYQLERCRQRKIRRLILTMPPRNLKSICASVAFPAFALGHDPTLRVVCVSYSQELTAKHSRDCRAVIESPWYKKIFPKTRIDGRKNSEAEFEMTERGYRLGTSVGGTLTGRGGNLIVIDDPLKPGDAMSETKRLAANEWYDSTLSSRLDNKTDDVIIVVMQRLHVDDLVGHLLARSEGWVHLNLPATADYPQEISLADRIIHRRPVGSLLHPEREPRSVLDELKTAMGSQAYSAQYQQTPVPPGGVLIQATWFRRYSRLPEQKPGDRIVQSWDTASKASKTNDYSVCTTWLMQGANYYLLDVLRVRLEFPDLRRRILRHAELHHASSVLIEDAGSGTGLIQELRDGGKLRPIKIRPEGDKVVRLEAQTAYIEAGHVLLPESAPWLGDFEVEVLAFPHGHHDDQVDSLSQFLKWAAAQRRRDEPTRVFGPILLTPGMKDFVIEWSEPQPDPE
ncbi:phage terminase large subunit [Myxococcota bacterium]|nr:phage terminase large subunit [Myxococcota bacterium]